ncbi:MAG: hypothetical protein AAB527_01365 [Patescibacteria group bacterium]
MSIFTLLKNNYFVLTVGVAVGLIYVLPNVFFITTMGGRYHGIPMMQTANEDFYLARIQEIVDGHPSLGSPAFFEYKNQPPLSPPVGEFIYALPSLIFGISPVNTLIVSRFFLPAILFFLVYYLIRQLTGNENILANKLNAVAGALWVTLGYDLIDYRSLINFFTSDQSFSSGFLIWARPVNPILGAVFLFSFLLFVVSLVQKKEHRIRSIFGASAFLALMIGSYFFSWGVAVSIVGVLILIYLFLKEYRSAGNPALVLLFGFLFALPYWYMTWKASQSPWYESSVLRSGLFYTRYPLMNKLLLAVLILFVVFLVFEFFRHRKIGITYHLRHWHWFCLAFILGGLWAYNQQIITGRTVWPYHFVQYTIPLAIVVVMTLAFYARRGISYGWHAFIVLVIFSSLAFGAHSQVSTYRQFYSDYEKLQSRATLFDWLNRKDKDCVVLVANQPVNSHDLNGLISAFTHCNTYNYNWIFSLMPDDRIYHNYLVRLFFNGATSETIQDYLGSHKREAQNYLFSNWKGLYGVRQFPDFSDDILPERLKKIPDDYRRFLVRDVSAELKKYRLDFILSTGPLAEPVKKQLPTIKLIEEINDYFIYQL